MQYVVDVEGRLSASVSRDSEDSSFVNVGTTTTTHAPDVGTGTEVEDIDEAGTESKQGGAKLTLLVEEEARALNVAAQSRSSSLLPIFIIIATRQNLPLKQGICFHVCNPIDRTPPPDEESSLHVSGAIPRREEVSDRCLLLEDAFARGHVLTRDTSRVRDRNDSSRQRGVRSVVQQFVVGDAQQRSMELAAPLAELGRRRVGESGNLKFGNNSHCSWFSAANSE